MVEVREVTSKEEWEGFLGTHHEANFLQSWYWGEFHNKLGHLVSRRGFYVSGKLVGVYLSIVEAAKRGRHLVVPAGPIIDWQNKTVIRAWRQDIYAQAKLCRCVFVRVRPQLLNDQNNVGLFRGLGFKKAPMHLHAELTSQLDLGRSDDEIKMAMRKGTRYEINQSLKLGIKVETAVDNRFLDEFYELQLETARRQKFVPFSKKFLSEQFEVFASNGKALMYRSSQEGKTLAMAFVIFYGDEAAYHYGASTDLARKLPGAYAVQWEAIQEARRRGCARYNFWGVAEHDQTKHRFYGVSVFKRGFGGDDVAYLPAQDLPVDKSRYLFTYMFETARRKIRKLG